MSARLQLQARIHTHSFLLPLIPSLPINRYLVPHDDCFARPVMPCLISLPLLVASGQQQSAKQAEKYEEEDPANHVRAY